ncbi:tetratricopeptide repeat protein [Mucilaginibacter gilvus]|uniref:Tetratricopeptide repeat protein n=1 Tax=Mucilaginibacter gilvus TaxID=2305909 RepID=A0A444MUU7_9SPHI|nr:tetratricopeptide repeat protein [Mucilaginibacter gilvus]RWY57403.1 tetratricopeptide repeat protein [Mucilaginibacter gilvus]
MKKVAFVIILTLCFLGKSFACLNGEVYVLGNHAFLYTDRVDDTPRGHYFFDGERRNHIKRYVRELDSLYRLKNDIRYLSDEGLVLVVLGEYKKAIALYQEIEMTEPDRYSTASNIGTAYELDGQNKQALFWIEKAVKLNEDSHFDSEWIHVNILKAKLGGRQLINSQFLLNTDFGTDSIPRTALRMKSLDSLSSALYYQLNERISFVKPKDKIVAQLLFDLSNITFLRGDYRVALADYQLAKEYGYDDKLIDLRIQTCQMYSRDAKRMYVPNQVGGIKKANNYIIIGLGIATLIIFAALMWRRRYAEAKGV